MPHSQRIFVSSPSFAKNSFLRDRLSSTFPELEVNYTKSTKDVTDKDEFLIEAQKSDYLIIGREILDMEVCGKLKHLKGISKYGVGLDNVDQQALKEFGVPFYAQAGVNADEVVELTLCHMISLQRKVFVGCANLKKGIWKKDGGTNLSGKRVGIIGFGNIGTRLAKVLSVLGCEVYANDILDKKVEARETSVRLSTKEEIYTQCDVVSLHTPLTNLTRHMIGERELQMMKPEAILINTARGGLVSEGDLTEALTNRQIAGAAVDVFETEPPSCSDLISLENFHCTPHIGGSSREASNKMGLAAIAGISRFLGHNT